MLYTERPQDFSPRFVIVSVFVEYADKILLLLRQDHKPQGNTWGVPAGKVEDGEELSDAMIRELREETGIEMPVERLEYLHEVYVRFPEYDFVYHMYKVVCTSEPNVVLDTTSHKKYVWVHPNDIGALSLIEDLDACITMCYGKNN